MPEPMPELQERTPPERAAGDSRAPLETGGATPSRPWTRALVGIFLAFLVVGNLDLAFGLDTNPNPQRDVVPFPRPRLDRSLLGWPGRLKWYVQSSMGFRPALVRARGWLAWHVLGVSPAPDDVVRADPWLFQRNERVLDDFRRVDPFTPEALARWATVLDHRRARLEAQGIRYLLVVTPNKETIYADDVPRWATRAAGPSRVEQLEAYLAQHTKVALLDLGPAVARERARGSRVYYYTDTHWNDRGAFAGYQAVASRLQPWFPALHVASEDDFVSRERLVPGGDLARICGLKADLPESLVELTPRPGLPAVTDDAGQPLVIDRMDTRGRQRFTTASPTGEIESALVLRDSFGEALVPFLGRHFRTATWIWTYDFPNDVVAALRPTLVIEQVAERKLMTIDPDHATAALDR